MRKKPEDFMENPIAFDNPDHAVAYLTEIYEKGKRLLERHFQAFLKGDTSNEKADARYPYLWIEIESSTQNNQKNKLAYGSAPFPGYFGTTVTDPYLYKTYLREQIQLLIDNHGGPVWVGVSDRQIPVTFALESLTSQLRQDQVPQLIENFHLPDLSKIDDEIANGTYKINSEEAAPLSLFTAERVDYSLSRLKHYTGTSPKHFQRFVLFTNYQRYVDEFIEYGLKEVKEGNRFRAFVQPGNHITYNEQLTNKTTSGEIVQKMPQMPAYHLEMDGHMGVTLINIGVGPSNAKTITDHIAVLRPHCWIMVGHCGGLRQTQLLGDYVLAHAYARLDHVLDHDLPLGVPIPAIAEVQLALTGAINKITNLSGAKMKQHVRTGTVVSIDDRNWELRYDELSTFFNQSRAIAVDMESATISANGFRLRVPYGTLLCVSDKPLHGEIKLPGMANAFYAERVSQHLEICLQALDDMRDGVTHESLHSRKLRSFDEPPFR